MYIIYNAHIYVYNTLIFHNSSLFHYLSLPRKTKKSIFLYNICDNVYICIYNTLFLGQNKYHIKGNSI